MGNNYYALVAGLPDILLEDKKTVHSSAELRENLREEVQPADFKLVELLYMPFDHQNLLNLLYKKEEEWEPRGNFSRDHMEQFQDRKNYEVADTENLPAYFADFLEEFHGEESFENYYEAEQELTLAYYRFLAECPNPFIQEVARYQSVLGNVMVALNGRKHEIPYESNLVGDDEITAALKKSRTRDFGLSNEVSDIELLIQIFETDNLLDRELKLDHHKWEFLDEITFFNYFTIEKVLAFVLKLFIVERWMELDHEKGKEMFNQLLNDLEAGFQFPEEFTLAYGKK
jgi:hypothetical protein